MCRICHKLLRFLFIALALFCLLLVFFRYKYASAIKQLAETQVRNITSDLINDAIDEQIEIGTIQYDRMVYFEKDLDGQITALKTNMSEVNRLKTNILDLINDEILAADSSRLGIPIGSLIFPEFFSGKGIQIPVTIHSVSNSDASFTSNFSEAGINQTLQQIIMDIQIDVTVLVLGKTNSFTISSHIVVAETVIVGQVPNTYFQAGGALNGS